MIFDIWHMIFKDVIELHCPHVHCADGKSWYLLVYCKGLHFLCALPNLFWTACTNAYNVSMPILRTTTSYFLRATNGGIVAKRLWNISLTRKQQKKVRFGKFQTFGTCCQLFQSGDGNRSPFSLHIFWPLFGMTETWCIAKCLMHHRHKNGAEQTRSCFTLGPKPILRAVQEAEVFAHQNS